MVAVSDDYPRAGHNSQRTAVPPSHTTRQFHVLQSQDLVDVDAITTNDVGAILNTFGVEAARATVVAEVVKVFGVYGIGVDRRHLGLIGDYMTHQVPHANPWAHLICHEHFLSRDLPHVMHRYS